MTQYSSVTLKQIRTALPAELPAGIAAIVKNYYDRDPITFNTDWAGTMPMWYEAGTWSTSRVRSIARLSFALPIFERCERPRSASVSAERLQPGRLAQGPEEKCGMSGRTVGIALLMIYPSR